MKLIIMHILIILWTGQKNVTPRNCTGIS